MLSSLLARAEAGEALWLPALRTAFAAAQDARPLVLRLSAPGRPDRDYPLSLPPAQTEAEEAFVLRFLAAQCFNLLSVWSGSELCLFGRPEDAGLADRLGELFAHSAGLGKALKVARRIYGEFRFSFRPLSDCTPLPPPSAPPHGALAAALRSLCDDAAEAGCLGLDVGGSDIKAAVSHRGRLLCTRELDWNPAASPNAEGILEPILALVREAGERLAAVGGRLDAVGISFPDVVIGDRIVGGETPKTKGMRENPALDYESAFARIRELKTAVLALCPPGARCRICNDGSMAAFTAALELAAGGEDEAVADGVIAHTLGTDLGSGWLLPDGTIPPIPLELYDLLLDLGSLPAASLPPADLRSSRNENSGLPGVRRLLGQAAAYRLAWAADPALLTGFTAEKDGLLTIPTAPQDLRKPCLEQLMRLAAEGCPEAEAVFRQIGRHLAVVAVEMCFLVGQTPPMRFLFGRFVKSRRCFALLCEGFDEAGTGLRLAAADEELANSPLMRQLAETTGVTVAQFGQAVGAICFALS